MPKEEIKTKRVPVDEKRWPGVYKYELAKRHHGRPDYAYTITFKNPVSGRKVWEKIGLKSEGITPQVCAELRAERMRKARHGEAVKTSIDLQRDSLKYDRPLGHIAKAYFEAKRSELKGYRKDLNRWEKHLEPIFEDRRVSSITTLDIQKIKTSLKDKAPATVWNTLELLRRLINWGARQRPKLCPPLPFTIKMPKRDNEVVEYLTPEQAQSLDNILVEWRSKDVVRLIQLAMLTGMRRGETFCLQDKDIDWQHNLISLRDPKGGESAKIPMGDAVANILKEQLRWRDTEHPGSPFAFPGKNGGQRVDCSAVKRIKAAAGLPKSFRILHGLRHHFAVTLANSGKVDLHMIGKLLTHKSEAMTRRYAAYLPETTMAASELAATLIQKNAKHEAINDNIINLHKE